MAGAVQFRCGKANRDICHHWSCNEPSMHSHDRICHWTKMLKFSYEIETDFDARAWRFHKPRHPLAWSAHSYVFLMRADREPPRIPMDLSANMSTRFVRRPAWPTAPCTSPMKASAFGSS